MTAASLPRPHRQTGSDAGLPTLLDYEYGLRRMLAFGQTLEFSWTYGGDPGIILENAVPYALAFQPFTDVPWLAVDPVSGTVVREPCSR